jgi:hypothetical protein
MVDKYVWIAIDPVTIPDKNGMKVGDRIMIHNENGMIWDGNRPYLMFNNV